MWYVVPAVRGLLHLPGGRLRRDRARAVRPARGRRRDRGAATTPSSAGCASARSSWPSTSRSWSSPASPPPASSAAGTARARRRSAPLWMLLKLMLGVVLLHLDPRLAAAAALRPADVVRLEGAAAAGDPQRPRDRDRAGGDLMSPCAWRGRRRPGRPRARAGRRRGASTASSARPCAGCAPPSAAWPRGHDTIEYPEEKTPVYPRFRGRHKLHRFEDTGLEKCVGCSLCAAACPAECIRVVAAENTPDNQVSAGERYAAVYEINMTPLHLLRLLRGGLPVRRDHDGQRLRAGRLQPQRPDLHEGDAARRPARAHAAAARGRVGAGHVVRAGPVLRRRASARWRARSAW